MKQIQLQLSQLRELDVRTLVHRNVPALPRKSATSTLVSKAKQVAALDAVGDCKDFISVIDAASIFEDQMFVRQHVWLINAMLGLGVGSGSGLGSGSGSGSGSGLVSSAEAWISARNSSCCSLLTCQLTNLPTDSLTNLLTSLLTN